MAGFMLELGQLESALDGYPVNQLLGFLGSASADERVGHCLVDKCLSSWISSLDAALETFPSEFDDALTRLEQRQRCARDALVRLKSALPRQAVVRSNDGQLC
jgi:hypothetical protein